MTESQLLTLGGLILVIALAVLVPYGMTWFSRQMPMDHPTQPELKTWDSIQPPKYLYAHADESLPIQAALRRAQAETLHRASLRIVSGAERKTSTTP